MNKIIIKFAVLMSFAMATSYVIADVFEGADIKTSTVGKLGKLAWPFLYMSKVSVASPDAPKLAESLAASFEKSGYKMEENTQKPTYVIIRDFRGKAIDYVPQSSNAGSGGGGWASALFSLGLNVLIGQKMGLVNTDHLIQSNANTVADTVRRAGDAYGNPNENTEIASAAEKAKAETNLVVYRLCMMGSCAYALSAGATDLDRLDVACFKDGILKLAGQEE